MELQNGRPETTSGRLDKEIRVYDLLDKLGIAYQRVDHEATMTMEACEEVDRILGDDTTICKNLFLCNRQETVLYMLVMPADKPFKTSVVSPQLGVARLHFADEKYMTEFLDLRPGSVSILGLMSDRENRVRLLMDRDLKGQAYFACHPCVNTSSLKFKTEDLFEKVIPAMGHVPTFIAL